VRSKLVLGGGGTLIVALAIYQSVAPKPLAPTICIVVFLSAIICAEIWHGLRQFERTHPPFRIGYPRQQFWDESERRGSTGMGYYFEVFNPSTTGSVESVVAQLVAIDPPDVNNLPMPLHVRNKLYATNEITISIPPNGVAGFDIVTGPDHNENSQKQVLIPCVVGGDRGIKKAVPISNARHRLTIRIMSQNHFKDLNLEVWVEGNFLRCEPCQTYVIEAH
jgi:hypothetical protein